MNMLRTFWPRRTAWIPAIGLVFSAIGGSAGATETIALVRPHGGITYYAGDSGAKAFPKGSFSEQFVSGLLTFNITYEDVGIGFTDPVTGPAIRERFKDVLDYVADVVNVGSRTLDIQVSPSETDGTGALATAGTFYPTAPGFHPGGSLQRLTQGGKPFPGFPEISVTVDVGFAWNVTSDPPGPGTADFFSVLLHEMTHGLGFTSLIEPDGSSSVGTGVFSTYDSFLTSGGNGIALIGSGNPPSFQTAVSSLTNDDVWFAGSRAALQYGVGSPVPVYAPSPFEPGSSISHWDTDILEGAAVMTHAIVLGSAQREYAPVDLGALIDLGFADIGGPANMSTVGCAPAARAEPPGRPGGGGVLMIMFLVALLVSTWAMQVQSSPGGKRE